MPSMQTWITVTVLTSANSLLKSTASNAKQEDKPYRNSRRTVVLPAVIREPTPPIWNDKLTLLKIRPLIVAPPGDFR